MKYIVINNIHFEYTDYKQKLRKDKLIEIVKHVE